MIEPGDRPSGSRVYDETILADPEIVSAERIDLHAERPVVTKLDVRGRLATITRRAVSVRKTIEVDVMHEEIHVEYQAGDGTEMLPTQPERFSIFLRAEEIEIVKHVRVVEEVVFSKRCVVEPVRFDVTLRHERLDVRDEP